jgi:hypothetical protein
MLILVQNGFVGFTALLNILDLFVYIAGDQIKEDHLDICKCSVGEPERKRPLGGLNVDGRTILKWILN